MDMYSLEKLRGLGVVGFCMFGKSVEETKQEIERIKKEAPTNEKSRKLLRKIEYTGYPVDRCISIEQDRYFKPEYRCGQHYWFLFDRELTPEEVSTLSDKLTEPDFTENVKS